MTSGLHNTIRSSRFRHVILPLDVAEAACRFLMWLGSLGGLKGLACAIAVAAEGEHLAEKLLNGGRVGLLCRVFARYGV